MQTRKIACAVMGALMITSVLAGCGKKENTTTAGNEGNSQVSQTQESSSKSEEKSTSQSNDQLESQISIFNGFTAQIPKGYSFTGTAGVIIFNPKDKTDLYISRSFDKKSALPLTSVTGEKIEESISQLLWVDDGIAKHITGYTKDVPVTVTSVTDAEVNGIKMKKFEGKLTLAKSSSDTNTTWDCYIYGYVLEAGPKTVGFFGLEQEQSQPADKIELIKKNMDAMVKTIKLI
jgi:hypothetical protein